MLHLRFVLFSQFMNSELMFYVIFRIISRYSMYQPQMEQTLSNYSGKSSKIFCIPIIINYNNTIKAIGQILNILLLIFQR